MSPEQVSLGERAQDTRTDIYSLGAMLYELLVGVLPLESPALRGLAFDEFERFLQEERPVKPSARLEMLGSDAAVVAGHRHTETPTLRRELRRDLDRITLKAVEKDPSRRYASS